MMFMVAPTETMIQIDLRTRQTAVLGAPGMDVGRLRTSTSAPMATKPLMMLVNGPPAQITAAGQGHLRGSRSGPAERRCR